jgi:hypothetical protein
MTRSPLPVGWRPLRRFAAVAVAIVPLVAPAREVRIAIDPDTAPLRSFVPARTLGAGIDGHDFGATRRLLAKPNLKLMGGVGFGPVSYRLRTELAIEAWHWSPDGHFSGKDGRSGYWTSEGVPGRPIEVSYGYRLPRRGSTEDQANNDGYSRLDDGDPASLWKSNPYLDRHFTGEDNSLHPQWVVIDFDHPEPVDALRIQWGEPHATSYRVEYCADPHAGDTADRICPIWSPFPQGEVRDAPGGDETRRIADQPVTTRYVRILLFESSYGGQDRPADIRDTLGYAIRELGIGTLNQGGRFDDRMRHSRKPGRQSTAMVSSTDPWHSAADRDIGTEQPGLDAFYRSGLIGADPPLIPVPLLYDTPENAAAEIAYLKRQGYPLVRVEMGEEPDGQYATPEDYGALYLQVADALHRIDPELKLGGPGFQTSIEGYDTWPIGPERRPWMTRFMDYLRSHKRESDLSFFSFEWYPFDDCCGDTSLQLAVHPRIFTDVLRSLHAQGLPAGLPWLVTEYGYSAFACRAEVDLEGALLNAELVGLALEQGAEQVFLYGWEPAQLVDELGCRSWGNNALFVADDEGRVRHSTATYHGARMVNLDWVGQPDEAVQLYPSTVTGGEHFGLGRVSAFALRLPDGSWSLLVLNKDPTNDYKLSVDFRGWDGLRPAQGPLTLTQLSRAQYRWRSKGEQSGPMVNLGPETRDGLDLPVTLPPYSVSVIRLGPQASRQAPSADTSANVQGPTGTGQSPPP